MNLKEINRLSYESKKLQDYNYKGYSPFEFLVRRNDDPLNPDFLPRNIILNFPAEEGRFGCRFNCDFCNWKNSPEAGMRLVPTNEAIDALLYGFKGYKATISGGGDSLFQYHKNKSELHRIIEYIHKRGFLVEVITKEITNLRKYPELVSSVDLWGFSIEEQREDFINTLKLIKHSRISKVLPQDSPDSYHDIVKYIHFYHKFTDKILLRENFYSKSPLSLFKKRSAKLLSTSSTVEIAPKETCANAFSLEGNKIKLNNKVIHKLK